MALFTTAHVGVLLHKLREVQYKAKDFGVKLGLKNSEIEAVCKPFPKTPRECLQQVFSLWLKQPSKHRTWAVLLQTLRCDGEQVIANTIESKYTSDQSVSVPLHDLLSLVEGINTTHWRSLGLYLGLSLSQINEIDDWGGWSEYMMIELLSLWVRGNGKPATLDTLVTAVRELQNFDLAERLTADSDLIMKLSEPWQEQEDSTDDDKTNSDGGESNKGESNSNEGESSNTKQSWIREVQNTQQRIGDMYRAFTFYEWVNSNSWKFILVAVKLPLHVKYVHDSFPHAEKDEAFNFRFMEECSHQYIGLKLNSVKNINGWKLYSHMIHLPCQILKRDIDLLGTHNDYSKLPMCVVKIRAGSDASRDFIYQVQVEGIIEKKTILIYRCKDNYDSQAREKGFKRANIHMDHVEMNVEHNHEYLHKVLQIKKKQECPHDVVMTIKKEETSDVTSSFWNYKDDQTSKQRSPIDDHKSRQTSEQRSPLSKSRMLILTVIVMILAVVIGFIIIV